MAPRRVSLFCSGTRPRGQASVDTRARGHHLRAELRRSKQRPSPCRGIGRIHRGSRGHRLVRGHGMGGGLRPLGGDPRRDMDLRLRGGFVDRATRRARCALRPDPGLDRSLQGVRTPRHLGGLGRIRCDLRHHSVLPSPCFLRPPVVGRSLHGGAGGVGGHVFLLVRGLSG